MLYKRPVPRKCSYLPASLRSYLPSLLLSSLTYAFLCPFTRVLLARHTYTIRLLILPKPVPDHIVGVIVSNQVLFSKVIQGCEAPVLAIPT